MEKKTLRASKILDIRFSEVDSMKVVWHGSYMLYFEDAREEFGRKYKLEYLRIAEFGYYAPLVDAVFNHSAMVPPRKNADDQRAAAQEHRLEVSIADLPQTDRLFSYSTLMKILSLFKGSLSP